MPEVTNNLLSEENRRQAAHQEVKEVIDEEVNARIMRESAQYEPHQSAQLSGVAHELKNKAVHEAISSERELEKSRTAARISQIVDYVFTLIYGLIALRFVLGLMGARQSNGFVQFIATITQPLLAPFERIVGTPAVGSFQLKLSYLLALGVYILLHLAINGAFRLMAHRKTSV